MKEGRLLGAQGNFTAGEAVPLGAYSLDEKGGLVFEGASKDMFILPPPTGGSYGETYYYQTSSLRGDQITPEIREKMRNQNKPNLDVRDLLLNQQEIEAILNKRLDALLNSQQANADAITALLNAMWGSGLINTGNTQTNVTGGDAAKHLYDCAVHACRRPAGTADAIYRKQQRQRHNKHHIPSRLGTPLVPSTY